MVPNGSSGGFWSLAGRLCAEYLVHVFLGVNTTMRTSRENVQVASWDLVPILYIVLEVLRDHLLGRMSQPVGELPTKVISVPDSQR